LQFSLQAASPETFGYTLLYSRLIYLFLGYLKAEEETGVPIEGMDITVIKSRSMRWVGHVARVAEMRNAYKFIVGKPKGGGQF
jgi:hypothetical protein